MGEAARRKRVGAANTHDRVEWIRDEVRLAKLAGESVTGWDSKRDGIRFVSQAERDAAEAERLAEKRARL